MPFSLPLLFLHAFSVLPAATEVLNISVGVVLPEETEDDLQLEAEPPALGDRIGRLKGTPYH